MSARSGNGEILVHVGRARAERWGASLARLCAGRPPHRRFGLAPEIFIVMRAGPSGLAKSAVTMRRRQPRIRHMSRQAPSRIQTEEREDLVGARRERD